MIEGIGAQEKDFEPRPVELHIEKHIDKGCAPTLEFAQALKEAKIDLM